MTHNLSHLTQTQRSKEKGFTGHQDMLTGIHKVAYALSKTMDNVLGAHGGSMPENREFYVLLS